MQHVHAMIDKEIASGINPDNVFICGFSQGGLSLSLSVCDAFLSLRLHALIQAFFMLSCQLDEKLCEFCRCLDVG